MLPPGLFSKAVDELFIAQAISVIGTTKSIPAPQVLVSRSEVEQFRSKISGASRFLDSKMGMDAIKLQLELEACKQPADLISAGLRVVKIVRARLGDKAANELELLLKQ